MFPSFTLFSKTWQTSHSDLLFYHFFGQMSLYLPGRRLTENIRTILCKVSSSKTFFTHSFLSGRWQLWPQCLERGQIPSNTLGPTSTWSLSKLLTQFLRMSVSHKFYHQHDVLKVSYFLEDTTLQSLLNAKLSKHGFWHCHENGLIKTIQSIPHNLYVSSHLPFTED